MRLAIVSLMGGAPWGGSEALWHALAVYALQQKDEVLVSVYHWGSLHPKVAELQKKGAVIHCRKRFNPEAGWAERLSRFIYKGVPSLNWDYQSIIDFKPELVFISQGESFDLAIHHRPLYQLLKQNGIPYTLVCHSHAQYSLIPEKEIFPGAVELFQHARRVYFVSHRQWQLTERRLACKLINGAFTWNPVNLQPADAPVDWPGDEVAHFAIVGNLGGSKGQDTALEVFSRPQWKERAWQLNIYGTGDGLLYLQSLARFYGISDRVHFKGFVDDIRQVWTSNHVLLIPSAGEGLPISLVEAMACGRPAIVTDVGGNTELITEGETGFVAASPTVGALASALERAWKERDYWQALGKNAIKLIQPALDKIPEENIYKFLKNGKRTTG